VILRIISTMSTPSVNQTQLVVDLISYHSDALILNGDDIEFSAFDWILSREIQLTDSSPTITLYDQTWIGRPKVMAERCRAVRCSDGSLELDRKSININDIDLNAHSWRTLPNEEALEPHVGLKVTYGRHAMLATSSTA